MNLVGELVLARNQIAQAGSVIEDPILVGAAQRLSAVTSELQEGVMKTRMQPIGSIWDKLPRVVRDLSLTCGKQVRVELEGRETELDRTIIEAIKDPLTHIVRNAVDHGIEKPDARAAAGKPRTASLRLRAYHEGGQVNIEIADDGAGIDVDAVRQRALERGLIDADRARVASERELIAMIFVPGFSTAKTVSNVSGRGVGMDVVKTNIERIGGTVDLISARGRGTTVRLKIPLTLAIVPALVVSCADERFAIPQASLIELVRGADGPNRVEWVHDAPVFRLRDEVLPLVYLDATLDLAPRPERAAPRPATNIVVLKAENALFGLVVDEVRDTQEIVVKPLGKELKRLSVFAGATIMGDGQVALIVDVPALARRLATVPAEDSAADDAKEGVRDERLRERFVVAHAGSRGHVAVPLHLVWRLEEFDRSEIKTVAGREVVVCRGEILRLIDIDGAPAEQGGESGSKVAVIVHQLDGDTVGVRVGRIVDIVEAAPRGGGKTDGDPTVLRVLDGEVAQLIDIAALHTVEKAGDRA